MSDIYQQALAAHQGTSLSPERRAEQEVKEYEAHLKEVRSNLEPLADTPEKLEVLERELARYKETHRKKYLAYLAAKSRTLSWMVTGRSNFPTRKNQKALATEERRLDELLDFRKRAMKAMRRAIQDVDAPKTPAGEAQKLREEVKLLEEKRAYRKRVNAAWRKAGKPGLREGDQPKWLEVARLMGVSAGDSARIGWIRQMEHSCRDGVPYSWITGPYDLKHLGAQIRQKTARVEELERRAAEKPREPIEGVGWWIAEAPNSNRIRLLFESKPDAETRKLVKSNGWRWAPSVAAWQRKLHPGGREAADRIVQVLDQRRLDSSSTIADMDVEAAALTEEECD